MNLLVLDLATQTGFCFGTEAGVVQHGSYRLPSTGGDIASFLNDFRHWLSGTISRLKPDEVVFEMPIMPATANLHTLRKLYSLCGVTELIARDMGCRVSEANLMDIRRHFIGTARAPSNIPKPERRQWIKDAVGTKARQCGFRPCNEDDADALGLFSYVMSCRFPAYVLTGTEIAVAA